MGMFDQLRFSINGDRQIERALVEMESSVKRLTLIKALSAGTAIIRDSAKRYAERWSPPIKDTGALIAALRVKRIKSRMPGEIAVVVKPQSKLLSYRTTKKGKLVKMGAKRLAKATASGEKIVKRNPAHYMHLVELGNRNVPPRPFLRAAYDADKGVAMDIIRGNLWASINRAKRELAKAK